MSCPCTRLRNRVAKERRFRSMSSVYPPPLLTIHDKKEHFLQVGVVVVVGKTNKASSQCHAKGRRSRRRRTGRSWISSPTILPLRLYSHLKSLVQMDFNSFAPHHAQKYRRRNETKCVWDLNRIERGKLSVVTQAHFQPIHMAEAPPPQLRAAH